jgi:hypothetical protein
VAPADLPGTFPRRPLYALTVVKPKAKRAEIQLGIKMAYRRVPCAGRRAFPTARAIKTAKFTMVEAFRSRVSWPSALAASRSGVSSVHQRVNRIGCLCQKESKSVRGVLTSDSALKHAAESHATLSIGIFENANSRTIRTTAKADGRH